jgi:hypothetical protein
MGYRNYISALKLMALISLNLISGKFVVSELDIKEPEEGVS